MITILTQPTPIAISGNSMAFGLASDAARLSCSLYLESEFGKDDFRVVHTEIRPLNSLGSTVFDLAAVLDAELELQPYDFASANKVAGKTACRRYFLAFKEGIHNEVALAEANLLSETKFVLKAKRNLAYFNLGSLPFTGTTLLSLKPSSRTFFPNQKDWLWLLPFEDAWLDVSFDTGNYTDTISFGEAKQYLPVGIPLHEVVSKAMRADPDWQVIKLEVLGKKLSLERAYEDLPYIREFHFENCLGGFDSLITYGKGQQTENISFTEAEKYLAHTDTYQEGEFLRYGITSRKSYKLTIGYRHLEEREAARAILYAAKAFERLNDKFLPLIITSQNVQTEKDGINRYTLAFEYKYAFNHSPLWQQDY